jgi:undecaprenyl diphosphate synthase
MFVFVCLLAHIATRLRSVGNATESASDPTRPIDAVMSNGAWGYRDNRVGKTPELFEEFRSRGGGRRCRRWTTADCAPPPVTECPNRPIVVTSNAINSIRCDRGYILSMSAQLIPVADNRVPQGRRRVPRHVGFIPDGNRRWAVQNGLAKEKGYEQGIAPGVALIEACKTLHIEEVSVFGFTQDNTRRPTTQANHFRAACVVFAREISRRGAALLVLGDEQSAQFPVELAAFRTRQGEGMKVNFLVNYGWEWDLNGLKEGGLRSAEVSRLDLIVRWGGGRRLSGFLPVQSVYADIFVIEALWPDFHPQHLDAALSWLGQQDPTLGG